jgi:PII-like signaling protein
MTLRPGPAARLTVYLKANARWHREPVYAEIVRRAHAAGLAGASVFRGDEGFGHSQRLHLPHLLSANGEAPCAVVVVDDAERLRSFLPQVEEVLGTGVALIQHVEVLWCAGREEAR